MAAVNSAEAKETEMEKEASPEAKETVMEKEASPEAKETEMEKEASPEAKETVMEREAREFFAERKRVIAEDEQKFLADRERLDRKYPGFLRAPDGRLVGSQIQVIMLRAKEGFDKAREARDAGVEEEEEEEEEKKKLYCLFK